MVRMVEFFRIPQYPVAHIIYQNLSALNALSKGLWTGFTFGAGLPMMGGK